MWDDSLRFIININNLQNLVYIPFALFNLLADLRGPGDSRPQGLILDIPTWFISPFLCSTHEPIYLGGRPGVRGLELDPWHFNKYVVIPYNNQGWLIFLLDIFFKYLIFPTKLIVIWDYSMLLIFTNNILTIFHKLYPFLNGINDVVQWT